MFASSTGKKTASAQNGAHKKNGEKSIELPHTNICFVHDTQCGVPCRVSAIVSPNRTHHPRVLVRHLRPPFFWGS